MGANTVMARLDSIEQEKIQSILEAPVLPSVSADDNGKVLMVVNGKWAVADLPGETQEETNNEGSQSEGGPR